MNREERIIAFQSLGVALNNLSNDAFQSLVDRARQENPWFTEESVRMAVRGNVKLLRPDALKHWTSSYDLNHKDKQIAVVMAGNIPMVGFHDFLCVLISGHNILIKSSSKDSVLMKFLVNTLIEIEPRFEDRISYGELLKGFDAIIATGSDNASRYFEYYFGKYPHIIRKNRTSVAILNGDESEADLKMLGTDVFSYFGLGCRNVSKLYVPEGYGIEKILKSWEAFHDIIHHHKYCNNYDYQKSILLVTQAPFLDNGSVMLQENQRLISPISVVYYEYYKDRSSLLETLESVKDKIQCVVENSEASKIKFGQSQFPGLGDYADQIDTLKFISELA